MSINGRSRRGKGWPINKLTPVDGPALVQEGHRRDELPQNLPQERPPLDRHGRVAVLAAAQLSNSLAFRRDGDERLVGIGPPSAIEAVPQSPPQVRVLEEHESVRRDDGLVEEGVETRALCVLLFVFFVAQSFGKRTHRTD